MPTINSRRRPLVNPETQPINGAVGTAASAQRQGYTGIDGGWDGVPVSGINPQGQRVAFINGRSPEDHALWQSQQQGQGAATTGTTQAGNNAAASQTPSTATGQTNAAPARPSIAQRFAALPNDVAMTVNQAGSNAPAAPASGQRPRIADSFRSAPAAAPYASGGNFNTQQATNDFAAGKITAAQRDQVYSAASQAMNTQGSGISPSTQAEMRGTAGVGQQLQASQDAQQAADAAYQRQHPGPPDVAHGGYGMLPAIPGQTQVAPTDGGSLMMFGANGPQTIAPGASVTSLPGNKTIIGGRGFATQVQSGAGAANPTQEAGRSTNADGSVTIRTASGGTVTAPAGTPVAGGGATGADTGMVGASGQQVVRNGQGQLVPGTVATPATSPAVTVSAAPSAMAAAGSPTLPATSFGPVPTSSRPQPLPADPNAFSGQPLALNTGTGTPNTTGQRISQSFTTQPLQGGFTPSYVAGTNGQSGQVVGGVMGPSDFAEPGSPGNEAPRAPLQSVSEAMKGFFANLQPASGNEYGATGDYQPGDGAKPQPGTPRPAIPATPGTNAAATGSLSSSTPAATATSPAWDKAVADMNSFNAGSSATPAAPAPTSTAAQTLANAPGYGADPASQSAQPAPLGKSALYKPGQIAASLGASTPGSGTTGVDTPPTTTATTPAGSTTFDTTNPLASPIKLDLNGTSPQRPRIADSFPPTDGSTASDSASAVNGTSTSTMPTAAPTVPFASAASQVLDRSASGVTTSTGGSVSDADIALNKAPSTAQALAAAPGFGVSPGTDAAVPASPGRPALAPAPNGAPDGSQNPAPGGQPGPDQDEDELRKQQASQGAPRPRIASMFA